jgi:hypothetical protein
VASVREVSSSDYDPLASFLAGFPDEPRNTAFYLESFGIWWDANPAFQDGVPRGWVITDNERVVGFLGNIPTFFQLNGRQIVAFSATTWRVLPDYRSQSLSLYYRLIASAKRTVLFDTTAADDGIRIREALKFQLMPRQSFDTGVGILRFDRVVGHKIGDGRVARALAIPLKLYQLWRRSRASDSEVRVERLTCAGSDFDRLWEETKGVYEHTNVRSAAAINWLCFTSTSPEKILLAGYKADRLCGYVICSQRPYGTLSMLECLDLWINPRDSGLVKILAEAALDHGQKMGCDFVAFPYFNRSLQEDLSDLGLFQWKSELRRDFIKVNPEVGNSVKERSAYFVGAQGDYGFFE